MVKRINNHDEACTVQQSSDVSNSWWQRLRPWLPILVITMIGAVVAAYYQPWPALNDWITSEIAVWELLCAGLITVVLLSLGFPGSVVSVVSGVLFGFAWGFPLAWGIALTAAHLTWAWGRLGHVPGTEPNTATKIGQLQHIVGASDWRFVGLLRLMPILPFALINFTFGRMGVSLSNYALGSALGMLPGTAIHVYLGSVGRRIAAGDSWHWAEILLIILGLVATALSGYWITRRMRQFNRDGKDQVSYQRQNVDEDAI